MKVINGKSFLDTVSCCTPDSFLTLSIPEPLLPTIRGNVDLFCNIKYPTNCVLELISINLLIFSIVLFTLDSSLPLIVQIDLPSISTLSICFNSQL